MADRFRATLDARHNHGAMMIVATYKTKCDWVVITCICVRSIYGNFCCKHRHGEWNELLHGHISDLGYIRTCWMLGYSQAILYNHEAA